MPSAKFPKEILPVVNILEEYIQNVAELLRVFMSHSYTYYINRSIEVQTVKDFYQLLLSLSQRKQQILLDNLHNRLSTLQTHPPQDIDDVPFYISILFN